MKVLAPPMIHNSRTQDIQLLIPNSSFLIDFRLVFLPHCDFGYSAAVFVNVKINCALITNTGGENCRD